jgi:heme/copper-type cytochrome/quinol oxidase subunit 1
MLGSHRRLGLFYVSFCAAAAFAGALLAVILRLELHAPGVQFIARDAFSIVSAGHGLLLTLSGVVPLMFCGFGHLLLSQDNAANERAFPRLDAAAVAALVIGFALAVTAVAGALALKQPNSIGPAWSAHAQSPLPNRLMAASVVSSCLALALASLSFIAAVLKKRAYRLIPLLVTAVGVLGVLGWDAALLFAALTDKPVPVFWSTTPGWEQTWNLADTATRLTGLVSAGIVLCCWTARLAQVLKAAPLLFYMGYMVSIAATLAGALLAANAGVDRALHNTYFELANEHMLSAVATTLAVLFGWHVLFRDIHGRDCQPSRALAQLFCVALTLILAIGPWYPLGLAGMPRGYHDYPDAFAPLNRIASIGTYLAVLAVFGAGLWGLRPTSRAPR